MKVIIVFLFQDVLSILFQLIWVACGWLECWRQGRKEIQHATVGCVVKHRAISFNWVVENLIDGEFSRLSLS